MLALLAAAGGVAITGTGVALDRASALPGQNIVDHKLGRCDVDVPEPRSAAGPLVTGAFASSHLRREVAYTIAYPPGHETGSALPVCLLLHGAGWGQSGWFEAMRFHRHLADVAAAGEPPFALAACDGGRLYWQPQPDGADPQAMVLREFLPLLAGRKLAVPSAAPSVPAGSARLGVLGCSMGGYGALLLGVTRPELFAAVVASSPALQPSSASDGGNDGPYDVIGRAARLEGLAVRVDCGERDPVRPVLDQLRSRLPAGAVRISRRGCHDPAFWEQQAPAQLTFVAQALTSGNGV